MFFWIYLTIQPENDLWPVIVESVNMLFTVASNLEMLCGFSSLGLFVAGQTVCYCPYLILVNRTSQKDIYLVNGYLS